MNISDVKHAVLEIDGAVSVIRFDDMPMMVRPHHHIRFLNRKQ